MRERIRFESELSDLQLRSPASVPIQHLKVVTPFPPAPSVRDIARSTEGPPDHEFRLSRLPADVRPLFAKGSATWPDAVAAAAKAGVKDLNDLADLIFFMHHPERITGDAGKSILANEREFLKLRVEWILCRTLAAGVLDPTATPSVFSPANKARDYEHYLAAPTTGRIDLFVNGKTRRGPKDFDDQVATFKSMQQTVESLGPRDSVYIANWQFTPTGVLLTPPKSGMSNWGDLLERKAKDGVKIRVIVSSLPPFTSFMTDLTLLEAIVGKLVGAARDNFKFIVSPHANPIAGSHHQKFLVAKKGKTTTAYCGGLDISFSRIPPWHPQFVWHDVHAKLEGLIARDLEREFVGRWNREKGKSTGKKLPGWKGFENLVQGPVDRSDQARDKNPHKLQMLRTISVGQDTRDVRRDDIWQVYFRLIARAKRFLYLENQYLHDPKLADAIVMQAQARPDLVVIVMVSTGTDDPTKIDPKLTGFDRDVAQAKVDYVQNGRALRHDFLTRLFTGVASHRLGVYTVSYPLGLLHSKLILADDEVLSMGSANANPRGFFLDSELNVVLDDADTSKRFRQQLWAHNLGVSLATVEAWKVSEFIREWNRVAELNLRFKPIASDSDDQKQEKLEKMGGEGVIPFTLLDVKADPGRKGPIRLPLGLTLNPDPVLF